MDGRPWIAELSADGSCGTMLELSWVFPPPNTTEIIEFLLLLVVPVGGAAVRLSGTGGTGGVAPSLSTLRCRFVVELWALCLPLAAEGLDAALFLEAALVKVDIPN